MGIEKFKMKNEKLKIVRKSFTLIEVLATIGVIALIIPLVFAIVFTLLRQQIKVYHLTTVKREGDYALNIISNLIRDKAFTIHSSLPPSENNQVCQIVETFSSPTSLYFQDNNNQWFGFVFDSDSISSSSAALISSLNSSKTIVDNFSIGCQKTGDYSSATVSLSFDICFNNGSGSCNTSRPEEAASLYYQTRIKLRNF